MTQEEREKQVAIAFAKYVRKYRDSFPPCEIWTWFVKTKSFKSIPQPDNHPNEDIDDDSFNIGFRQGLIDKNNLWIEKIQKRIDDINCMDSARHYTYQSALLELTKLLEGTK